MRKINYDTLRPGYIIGTTMTIHPMAMITKITTAGMKNIFNPNIATHCLAVCQEHDLLYGMEMTYPKIRQVDLCDYEHCRAGNHIVFIAKIPDIFCEKANNFLLESHRRGIKYDIAGLLEFWGLTNDNKKKLYCSELIRQMFKYIPLYYPKEWDEKVSPYAVQNFTKEYQFKWWKSKCLNG